jgi:hypothetical protein
MCARTSAGKDHHQQESNASTGTDDSSGSDGWQHSPRKKSKEKPQPPKPEAEAGIALAWDLVGAAIGLRDHLLCHLFVDRLCRDFPRALLRCPWPTVMVDMCQAVPEVFHHLLWCLRVGWAGGRVAVMGACGVCLGAGRRVWGGVQG